MITKEQMLQTLEETDRDLANWPDPRFGSPAPTIKKDLTVEVEEAMGKIENLLGGFGPNVFRDEFGRRIHYPRDTMAALAVIQAALRPKVVSREWFNELTVAIMYHHGTDETQGIIQPVAKGMLREKGIVVGEKP